MKQLFVATVLLAGVIQLIAGQCLSENDIDAPFDKQVRFNLYAGQQAFTLAMLEQVNKVTSQENVFFSPYSVFHALLLGYFGSKGQTESAFKNVLRLNWADNNKFNVMQAYRLETMLRMKRSKNSSVEFRSADRLFFDQTVKVKDCMEELFVNDLQTMDFRGQPVESAKAVNKWIEQQTKGEIKDLLSAGDITENTKAVLANAAYLKGAWASQFEPELTKMEVFFSPNNQSFVQMMNKEGTFNHGVNEVLEAHVLEMPYEGEETDMSFYIFLPPHAVPNALEKMLSKLTLDTFVQAINDVQPREVNVKVPKFSFEKTLKIVPILEQMGIGDVFQSSANFTGFADEQIVFDDATHKAKIIVDEEGSTAAAATVLFSFRSSRPLEPAQFHCTHPFMFAIYDHQSKAVLFTGIYRGPHL